MHAEPFSVGILTHHPWGLITLYHVFPTMSRGFCAFGIIFSRRGIIITADAAARRLMIKKDQTIERLEVL